MLKGHQRNSKWRIGMPMVAACCGLAVASASFAAGTFDGVYRGSERTTKTNNSAQCSRLDHDTVLRIQDNHFTRTWGPANFSVDVAADGSFDAKMMEGGARGSGAARIIEIKGKITGGNLEADVGSPYCSAHLSLKKS